MSLEDAKRQKSGRPELTRPRRGEAPTEPRSGEARSAADGDERSGTDHLMEEVVERRNMQAALKRVRQNKGSPGVDGMTVQELPQYLKEHWPGVKAQFWPARTDPRW